MFAKDRLLEALAKDREERERRLAEGTRPFPVIGQLDSDGENEPSYPFLPVPEPRTVWKPRQWMTGPVLQ